MIKKGNKWILQIISEFPGHFADWRQNNKSLDFESHILLPLQNFNGFQRHHHHWMEWLGATIGFNGFFMVLGSGNHWFRWFSMVVHHWSDDGMVIYHRWSLRLNLDNSNRLNLILILATRWQTRWSTWSHCWPWAWRPRHTPGLQVDFKHWFVCCLHIFNIFKHQGWKSERPSGYIILGILYLQVGCYFKNRIRWIKWKKGFFSKCEFTNVFPDGSSCQASSLRMEAKGKKR